MRPILPPSGWGRSREARLGAVGGLVGRLGERSSRGPQTQIPITSSPNRAAGSPSNPDGLSGFLYPTARHTGLFPSRKILRKPRYLKPFDPCVLCGASFRLMRRRGWVKPAGRERQARSAVEAVGHYDESGMTAGGGVHMKTERPSGVCRPPEGRVCHYARTPGPCSPGQWSGTQDRQFPPTRVGRCYSLP